MTTSFSDSTSCAAILEGLVTQGYIVVPNFYSPEELSELLAVAVERREENQFRAAAIGKGQEAQRKAEIRGDFIYWLSNDDSAPAVRRYWDFIEELRVAMNRALMLGLFEYEGHFAAYPAGSFYKRHLDCFQDQQRRRVTTILYLNDQSWSAEDGGQLRLYTDSKDDSIFLDVLPRGGTFVVFLSDAFPHEVLPTQRERLSLTGWFCRRPIGNALVF
ncbi:MAG: 2OG-Fe(II) oxygenase [Sumerlaeia bacterium]